MPNPSSVTLSLDEATLAKMAEFYHEQIIDNGNETMLFFAKCENVAISAYKKAKNGLHKVLFQGENAAYEASIWGTPEIKEEIKETPIAVRYPQIGSDEVGTGDFFGPITVAATLVQRQDVAFLKSLGVADSKTLTDEKIRLIAPQIIARIPYSQLCLPNEKYNELVRDGLNMNAIKAKMHNRCLLNLKAKCPAATLYVDQFAIPKTYYGYLKDEPEVARNIVFATKGESKFLSVAAASIIARYSFLRHMDALGEEFHVHFPYGAGSKVDDFASQFAQSHGLAVMEKVAKTNFANFKKLG